MHTGSSGEFRCDQDYRPGEIWNIFEPEAYLDFLGLAIRQRPHHNWRGARTGF